MSVDTQSYYDMISAFIKSMRGSDCDAACFWFNRLIESGCEPMLLARRIVIHASEDVGLADPQALVVAVSAMTAFQNIGLPEGRIPLTQAILYICRAPKSNSVVTALNAAKSAAEKHADAAVPLHLSETYKRASHEEKHKYLYPHDFGGWVKQQYLPDAAKGEKYYFPTGRGQDVEKIPKLKIENGEKMLNLTNVSKTYPKSSAKAVDSLNLDVKDGEIFGFLGPNGAGKSTTIKLITGILNPDEGAISVDGMNIADNRVAAKNP